MSCNCMCKDLDILESKPKDECGVFGVYNKDGEKDAAQTIYYGIYALQHRGQESCGIAVNDDGEIHQHKDLGMVPDVFTQDRISKLEGSIGIGHVRYATLGENRRENAQPLVSQYKKGTLSVALNGVVLNAAELKQEFENNGAIFQTTSDAEVIAYVIAKERIKCHSIEEALAHSMKHLRGTFSLVVMSPRKLVAARDPLGLRPLCIGETDNAYVVSSETCALNAVGARFVRDVEAGEVVCIDKDGIRSDMSNHRDESNICIFEYVYVARPDSVVDGVSVYEARVEGGKELARSHPVDADLVIAVPDSGIDAAVGYAEESGIPYGIGLIKNRYIGRTFIQPTQKQRVQAVKIKLNVLASTVKDKRIVMVDDSIVRGTTSRHLVEMLRDAGAKEVHMRVCAPPFIYPCYFGTDIPNQDVLIACKHSVEEIRQMLGADSLGFLECKSLKKMLCGKKTKFCDACFTGNYLMDVPFDGKKIEVKYN